MKVTGPSGAGPAQPSRTARSAAGGFSLGASAGAAPTAAAGSASAAAGLAGVGALMALQGVEDATERRRRAIRRGGGLLDRLDEIKLSLLSGGDGAGALESLSRAIREERPEEPDSGLKAVLDQIDLRAAVELAKFEARRTSR